MEHWQRICIVCARTKIALKSCQKSKLRHLFYKNALPPQNKSYIVYTEVYRFILTMEYKDIDIDSKSATNSHHKLDRQKQYSYYHLFVRQVRERIDFKGRER